MLWDNASSHNRKLTQEQDGITYVINYWDICADIALRSNCGFSEVFDFTDFTVGSVA